MPCSNIFEEAEKQFCCTISAPAIRLPLLKLGFMTGQPAFTERIRCLHHGQDLQIELAAALSIMRIVKPQNRADRWKFRTQGRNCQNTT
eukprot:scaffold10833_cov78-Skeletonema_dohrnii-CCMP3373.AAC.3